VVSCATFVTNWFFSIGWIRRVGEPLASVFGSEALVETGRDAVEGGRIVEPISIVGDRPVRSPVSDEVLFAKSDQHRPDRPLGDSDSIGDLARFPGAIVAGCEEREDPLAVRGFLPRVGIGFLKSLDVDRHE